MQHVYTLHHVPCIVASNVAASVADAGFVGNKAVVLRDMRQRTLCVSNVEN